MTRSTQALAWIADDQTVDIDFDERTPDCQSCSAWWYDGSIVRAQTAEDAFALVRTYQSSGTNDDEASRVAATCLLDIGMLVDSPAVLTVYADSLFQSEFDVTRPTRLLIHYAVNHGERFETRAELSLRRLSEGGTVELFGDLAQNTGGQVVDTYMTLPVGRYVLEVNASIEVAGAIGFAETGAGAAASLAPSQSCNAADIAEPFGVLDAEDVIGFLSSFAGEQNAADLAPPLLTFNLTDVLTFLDLFGAGCP